MEPCHAQNGSESHRLAPEVTSRPVRRLSGDYRGVRQLYRAAFPEPQRYAFSGVWLTAAWKRPVEFLGYYDGDRLCGLTYTVDTGRYLYLFYIAVPEDCRGRGYGARMLDQLRQRHPDRTIVLDVETPDPSAPNNEQRLRRVAFYERNGFFLLDRYVKSEGHSQQIMSTSREFDAAEYWKGFRLMGLKTLARVKKVQKLLHLWR